MIGADKYVSNVTKPEIGLFFGKPCFWHSSLQMSKIKNILFIHSSVYLIFPCDIYINMVE